MTLRQTVVLVAFHNLVYFGIEFAVAIAIGRSLFADSVDFLEDAPQSSRPWAGPRSIARGWEWH
jgi:hypothetical protein